MVEARLRVIYGDTDQMGVVYYANYFRYFEFARGEFLRQKGGRYRDMEQQLGIHLPVVDARCRYRISARYDDVLLIRVRISELRRASLVFDYEMHRDGTPDLLCTGQTIHACVDREGQLKRLPEEITKLLAP